jgi:hypothetical protein
MGFNWQPHTLLLLMGGAFALHHLCLLATPLFLLLGVLVGGPWIQKGIYQGGACHMGFGRRPCALLLSMWGALALPLWSPDSSSVPLVGPTHVLDIYTGVLSRYLQ